MDVPGSADVQATGRVDGDNKARIAPKRPREQQFLLVAAGQFAGPLGRALRGDPEAGEGVDDPDFGAEILIDEVRVYGSYLDDPAWERAMAGAGQPDRLYYDFEVVVQEPTPQNAWRCFKAGTPKGAPKFPGASGELDNVVETKQTDIGKPRSVCVPTARDGSPIPDDSVSLVCYQAKDAKTSPPQSKFQKVVQVLSNPLGAAQSLELKKADVYCEPSTLVMP